MRPKFKPGTAEIDDEVAATDLAQLLGSLAEVRMPQDAEQPILAPSVRQAVFDWMVEIRAKAQLEAAKIKPRSTALLYGPPGCGKTTLAHHLAARLGVPLVVMEAAAVHTMYIGQTGQNLLKFFQVLDLYQEATGNRVVVLLDEIDVLGGKRSGDSNKGEKDADHTVNTLLTQIEKFDGILIAATNMENSLDPALWRRFGMQIKVELPGPKEAFAIFKSYSLPYQFDDAIIHKLVALTRGAPPSLMRQLMEGLKRALVLYPVLKRPVDDPAAILAAVAAGVSPHPDYQPVPALWRDKDMASHLKGLPWPPAMGDSR